MTAAASHPTPTSAVKVGGKKRKSQYPGWFYLPAAVIYGVFFLLPTFSSAYYSLTRWTLDEATFIGLENFAQFLREPFLVQGLINTLTFAVVTSGMKVVLGLALGVLLTSEIVARGWLRSVIFFPVLVSTIGVGITFTVLMHPTEGMINHALAAVGIPGPAWLTNPKLALLSVALVDVWKGVGLATIIFIAGMAAIPVDYYEAARIDRASAWQRFRRITLPLLRPAIVMVVIMRTMVALTAFAAIFTVTGGGPGTATEILNLYAYRKSFTELSIGYGSALAVALLIVTIIISAVLFAVRRAK